MGEVYGFENKKKISQKELEKIPKETIERNSKDLRDEVQEIISEIDMTKMNQEEMVEKAGEIADFLVSDDGEKVRKIRG